jgi:hypothetical protein
MAMYGAQSRTRTNESMLIYKRSRKGRLTVSYAYVERTDGNEMHNLSYVICILKVTGANGCHQTCFGARHRMGLQC